MRGKAETQGDRVDRVDRVDQVASCLHVFVFSLAKGSSALCLGASDALCLGTRRGWAAEWRMGRLRLVRLRLRVEVADEVGDAVKFWESGRAVKIWLLGQRGGQALSTVRVG